MFAAAVPWLALTRRAMADNICTVAVRTVQGLENHSTSQMCWGGSAARRSQSIAHQHLCDIFQCCGHFLSNRNGCGLQHDLLDSGLRATYYRALQGIEA